MDRSICSIQEDRLVDRLQSLMVKGEIIEKRRWSRPKDQPEKRVVIIRFKDRRIEKQVDESEFKRAEIGGQTWFTPPIPERDACVCHCFVWLIGGIAVGLLCVWAITSHFQGKTAAILSLAAVGWIGVLAWARISCLEQNRCLRDLERELRFFESNSCEGDRQP